MTKMLKKIAENVAILSILTLLCVVTMGENAYSKVCFLPDDSDCADGTTSNFWPGSSGGNSNDGTACDASYNSRKSVNECGASCVRCVDGGKYNGLYKCPANTCNCNGYNSVEAVNACGDACELCTIAGDRNYGKYKCPPATNPCDQCEEECKFEEADTAAQLASDPCMECEPCNNQYCTGKWRCAINQACKTCRDTNHTYTPAEATQKLADTMHATVPNCYTWECNACGGANAQNEQAEWYECHKLTAKCSEDHTTTNSTLSDWEKTNHCYSQCDICYDDAHYTKWHCDCLGYDTQTCGTNQSPIEPGCTGKGGKWYSGCCNNCSGCYASDITDADKGWSCTKVENACTSGNKGTSTQYNCLCSPTCGNTYGSADATKQASDAWKEDTCSDCDGTHYKYSCAGGYHADGNGGCAENCDVVTCGTAITSKPSNSHYTTCTSRTTTCAETTINTGWECDANYHKNSAGTGCDADCNVTCTAVTIPANAHGTTTCQAKNADCTNNGSAVYTAWECNSGYRKNSAGTGCEAIPTPTSCTKPDIMDYTRCQLTDCGRWGTNCGLAGAVTYDHPLDGEDEDCWWIDKDGFYAALDNYSKCSGYGTCIILSEAEIASWQETCYEGGGIFQASSSAVNESGCNVVLGCRRDYNELGDIYYYCQSPICTDSCTDLQVCQAGVTKFEFCAGPFSTDGSAGCYYRMCDVSKGYYPNQEWCEKSNGSCSGITTYSSGNWYCYTKN